MTSNHPFAFEVEDLWKRYYVHRDKHQTLKSAVLNRFRRVEGRQEFWALQGVTLRVRRGRTMGIIGNNGAGKSTLLRVLSGVSRPTRGRVRHHGRISTLLEIGTGFHPEMSGRANVYTSAIVSGLTRAQVGQRFADIVDFAELWDFIDAPVRTYSSGMFLRLAFATAINIDPDIILVDEVLAVGDLRFQEKCLDRLRELQRGGTTIVFVSHAMGPIEDFCDEVVWLDQGKVRAQGTPHEVVPQYKNRLSARQSGVAPASQLVAVAGAARGARDSADGARDSADGARDSADGARDAHSTLATAPGDDEDVYAIDGVHLYDETGAEISSVECGDMLAVELSYRARRPGAEPIIALAIFRDDGIQCYEAITEADGVRLEAAHGDHTLTVVFPQLTLMRGEYYVSAAIHGANWERIHDYRHRAATFTVEGYTPGNGVSLMPHRWSTGR